MTTPTKPKGGVRPGSGRKPDYRKQALLFAIGARFCCSEATAKRQLRDAGGNYQKLIDAQAADAFERWDELTEFERGRVFGWFETDNLRMRERNGLK